MPRDFPGAGVNNGSRTKRILSPPGRRCILSQHQSDPVTNNLLVLQATVAAHETSDSRPSKTLLYRAVDKVVIRCTIASLYRGHTFTPRITN